MMRFVVLPGLDGDAASRTVFLEHLRTVAPTEHVVYPPDRIATYAEARRLVETVLPQAGDFVLIAESFSGPLACAIAGDHPPGLRGLVLVASFARYPWPWLKPFVGAVRGMPKGQALDVVLRTFLVGNRAAPIQLDVLRDRVRQLHPSIIRARLNEVLVTDARPALVRANVPTLVLQASQDRLVPKSAANHIARRIPAAAIRRVNGPHALLQMAPEDCAECVIDFAASLDSIGDPAITDP